MWVCTSIMPGIAVYLVRSVDGPLHGPTDCMRSASTTMQASRVTFSPSHTAAKWYEAPHTEQAVLTSARSSRGDMGKSYLVRHNRRMAPTEYDLISYPAMPRQQTHPDRLAAVGKLFGMKPAPVERCRVLEIGCSDGGNLIPMACALPESRFVGLDLAAGPITEGKNAARDLKLDNLALHACDLREIDESWGEFDYILAHGLYSWVPPEVRERILSVCRERLSADGIAFISYNAYPGGHIRQIYAK